MTSMATTTTTVTTTTVNTTSVNIATKSESKSQEGIRKKSKKSQETATNNRKSTNSNESTAEKQDTSVKFTLNEYDDSGDDSQSVEQIVERVLNEMVALVEIESNHQDGNANENGTIGQAGDFENDQSEDSGQHDTESEDSSSEEEQVQAQKAEETARQTVDESDGRYLIDTCLIHLKQLCYTFFSNHMFLNDQSVSMEDQIAKSFSSLFNGIDSVSLESRQHPLVLDDQANYLSVLGTVNFMKLKQESLTYLQSFQILNKLLIKMLFFPREPSTQTSASSQNLQQQNNESNTNASSTDTNPENTSENETEKFSRSFENWLKSLFVISCSSQFATHSASVHAKLFEFQSVTLNTIIELIHLSESVNSHFNATTNEPVSLVAASQNFSKVSFT
jgi:hypothetical protein